VVQPFLFTPFKSSIPGESCHLPKEAAAFEGEAIVVPAIPDVSHGIHGQITSGILWQCPIIHSCGWASEIRITSCFNGGKNIVIYRVSTCFNHPKLLVQDFAIPHPQ